MSLNSDRICGVAIIFITAILIHMIYIPISNQQWIRNHEIDTTRPRTETPIFMHNMIFAIVVILVGAIMYLSGKILKCPYTTTILWDTMVLAFVSLAFRAALEQSKTLMESGNGEEMMCIYSTALLALIYIMAISRSLDVIFSRP